MPDASSFATHLAPAVEAPITTALTTPITTAVMSAGIAPVLAAANFVDLATRAILAVPAVLHEVDRPAAGVVLVAMLAPVLLVGRRHPQVDRFRRALEFGPGNDHRLLDDQLGLGESADVDSTVDPRLADAYGHADVSSLRWHRCSHHAGEGQRQNRCSLHRHTPGSAETALRCSTWLRGPALSDAAVNLCKAGMAGDRHRDIAQAGASAAARFRLDAAPAAPRQSKKASTSSRRASVSASPKAISARVYGASNSR